MTGDAAARAQSAAARLAELIGVEAEVTEVPGGVHVVLELPSGARESNHLEVLAVLRAADRFGHRRSADGVEQLWATYYW